MLTTLWGLARSFLLGRAAQLLGVLAAVAGAAVVLFGARQAGRNAERVTNLRDLVKRLEAQRDAAARGPRSREELKELLRDGRF